MAKQRKATAGEMTPGEKWAHKNINDRPGHWGFACAVRAYDAAIGANQREIQRAATHAMMAERAEWKAIMDDNTISDEQALVQMRNWLINSPTKGAVKP